MTLSLQTLGTEILARKMTALSVFVPQTEDGKWAVNLRRGPGWVMGSFENTLEAAFEQAISDFSKTIGTGFKSADRGQAPVVDDLTDLLG